jgi:hypothetical protein
MPDPVFTDHGAKRVVERGITSKQIIDAVSYGHIVERTEDRDIFAFGRLRVVVSRANGKVITTWRMRKINAKRILRKIRKLRRRQS